MEDLQDETKFDPYDKDREEFNASLCMVLYAENKNFKQIMSDANNIEIEINGITSDIQNLLYGNYSKFIAASHVISKINSNFGEMAKDMDLLQGKISDLDNTSFQILGNLQQSKDKLLRLLGFENCVDKYMILIDLVPKLQKYVEDGEYTSAAHHYLKIEHNLKQYHGLETFRGIIEDSKDIVSYIQKKLSERLDCSIFSCQEIAETLSLIVQLGEGEIVLKDFLLASRETLNGVLVMIDIGCGGQYSDKDTLVRTAELELANCTDLSSKYLTMLSKVIKVMQIVYSTTPSLKICSILENFVSVSIDMLSVKIKQKYKEYSIENTDEFLAMNLDKLYRSCCDCSMRISKIAMSKNNAEIILDICNDICMYHLKRMKYNFRACLEWLDDQLKAKSNRLDEKYTRFSKAVDDIFLNSINSFCHYVKPEHRYSRDAHFRKMFCKIIVRERIFISFINYVNSAILELIPTLSSKDESFPSFYILLSRFALDWNESKASNFLSLVDERLHSPTGNICITPVSEIARSFQTTTSRIVHHYVEVRQRLISTMFKNSLENKKWLTMKEPWKISSVVRRVNEDFLLAAYETNIMFGSSKILTSDRDSDVGKTGPSSAFRSYSLDKDSMDDEIVNRIQKLFLKPPEYSVGDLTGDSVLNSIIKMSLKSLLECVRLKTFNKFGFQQIQVDSYCTERQISQYMNIEKDLDTLFDDIVSSCANRTLQPEPMNPYVALSICQNF